MKLTIEIKDDNKVVEAAKVLLSITHNKDGWKGLNFMDRVKLMKATDKLNDAVLNYGTVQIIKRRS